MSIALTAKRPNRLNRLKIGSADLIGCSIGGWIAADMATKTPERFRHMVLVGPVGVKVGPIDKLDIPDIFAMPQDKLNMLLYHDPQKSAPNFKSMPEQQLQTFVRNRETLALLAWSLTCTIPSSSAGYTA